MSQAARILEMPSRRGLDSLDDCRVVAQLGQGGMAEVFLATRADLGAEELVVVKRLHPHLDEDPTVVTMFLDEARIALRLLHPNIVRSYAVGLLQGRHAIVMEYLEGQPVHRVLTRASALKRPLPREVVIQLIAEALEGLHYAHEARTDDGIPLDLVHRDVSPHNLLLTSEGQLKLLDFGIAKTAFQENRTRTGLLKGKVAYMAPEQAWGRGVDRRADLWSIGVVLWEMLAGKRLFKAENEAASLHNTLNAEIPRLGSVRTDIPADLERIVIRALQRNPEHRYPTAGAMALELRGWARAHALDVQPAAARKLFAELFGEELAQQRRRIDEILVPNDAGPISGSVPLPRLHLPAAAGGAAPGTNLSGTVALQPEPPQKNPVLPLLWSLLVVAGFAIGLLAYDVFTRPPLVTSSNAFEPGPMASPVAVSSGGVAPIAAAATPLALPAPAAAVPAAIAEPAAATVPRRRPLGSRAEASDEMAAARPAPKSAPQPATGSPSAPLAAGPGSGAAPSAEFGYLTLDTSPWSNVSAGGTTLGQTPIVRARLPAGTHTLVLVNPDQNLTTRYQVRIEPGKTTVRRIGLE
jgi:eukaryotic-like serine/threonine-protein kinase